MIEWVLETWKKLQPMSLLDHSKSVFFQLTWMDQNMIKLCVSDMVPASLLKKLKVARLDEVGSDPFDIEVPEEDMCQEDITELIIYDDDEDD